jgi:hypothetical protein
MTVPSDLADLDPGDLRRLEESFASIRVNA